HAVLRNSEGAGSGVGSDSRAAGAAPVLAVAVAVVLLAAAATTALGLEAVLGGFATGIVLGALPPAHRAGLAPLLPVVYGVLAPLYFANAGLHADLSVLVHPGTLVA